MIRDICENKIVEDPLFLALSNLYLQNGRVILDETAFSLLAEEIRSILADFGFSEPT